MTREELSRYVDLDIQNERHHAVVATGRDESFLDRMSVNMLCATAAAKKWR
jgi:hypothetical protein